MLHAFFFTFTFDDDNVSNNVDVEADENGGEDEDEDEDESEEKLFSMGFSLSPECHAQVHSEWFGDTTDELEEKYHAVHDYTGHGDENSPSIMDGFSTYEIADKATARILFAEWRAEWVKHVGEEGMGPTIEVDGDIEAALLSAQASENTDPEPPVTRPTKPAP